ncbi:Na+/phosphate symporter [Caldicoprobacter guelmensis]|nr:Na+/phosphate symporter [Caldicoprobacter guelmensis]
MQLENLFSFIGGLGLFIYGMKLMGDGLEKIAGNRLKSILGYLTKIG